MKLYPASMLEIGESIEIGGETKPILEKTYLHGYVRFLVPGPPQVKWLHFFLDSIFEEVAPHVWRYKESVDEH